MADSNDVRREQQRWVDKVYKPSTAKAPERRETFATSSGIVEPPVESSPG